MHWPGKHVRVISKTIHYSVQSCLDSPDFTFSINITCILYNRLITINTSCPILNLIKFWYINPVSSSSNTDAKWTLARLWVKVRLGEGASY